MRLDEPPQPTLPAADLEASVAAVLDSYLALESTRPVAVALSGGGDSTALLIAAKAWAQRRRRPLLALTVDHRLQRASAAWTEACAGLAQRHGVAFRALSWEGPKPATGVPAAAREARHRLLARAARAAGARVILFGHTDDDVTEAAVMRAEGSTTPAPRLWSPSPAWPAGRGVFLLRPLLGARRAALRAWLTARGESWIDDPSNEDMRYARSRARAAGLSVAEAWRDQPDTRTLAAACHEAEGALSIGRAFLRQAEPAAVERFLAIACVCASGHTRPPRGGALARLAAAVRGPGRVHGTLAGARIEADGMSVRIMREAGREGLATASLPTDAPMVWDGRFEIRTSRQGLTVGPLAGSAKRLGRHDSMALRAAPPRARGTLPIISDGEYVFCPALNPVDGVEITALAGARLFAACGLVEREPA